MHLESVQDSLHPGVHLHLLDAHVAQGMRILPLATALHQTHELVKIKGYNALHPCKPAAPEDRWSKVVMDSEVCNSADPLFHAHQQSRGLEPACQFQW